MMIVTEEGIEQLQQEFTDARIDTDSPGFYENGQFIRREQKYPYYLDNYARFVQWQPYSETYLERAESIIHVVSEELQLALKDDGSVEAHAESPLVMARILEREGVWNYVVKGALAITFPASSGFEPFSFPAIELHHGRAIDCAYQWIVAPPFQIIDFTIQACHYPSPFNHLLPKIVWEADGQPTDGDPADLFSDNARKEIAQADMSTEDALDRYLPNYRSRFSPDFPARTSTYLDTQLMYMPTGVVVPEILLEQFTCFQSRGLSAAQIYAKKIRPRLS